ncbi:diphthine--ammonia ligase [Sulfurisphaera ohwakuensis]|uniref:ABC transporter with metal-binding/Fe-S-binding domain ATP-binding protein n=1 Tax=Sulfurisphaera ohwakuensis TaxID=69656 RepID=A0A650CII9_SULOH|nr:diphthine--ammonia ligase [Sulfurisphaera ohwakuensis]MBB5253363.1 ABC transporter with metal-binding/Fe-S-binding domain ATP-binding protein [Sulfurisphaera ohwakuensis]QGR17684.1 diphthine--ammonia ligase [Sulfurisphaera ohwakuensis]
MKICTLFSGGKDSTYSLHWAMFKGFEILCLITLLPKKEYSWMFQVPNVELTKYQAEVLGIPLLQIPTSGEKDKELEDLKIAFKKAKELGARGIVTGALLSDYQRLNINIIAEEVGLKTYSPLWRKKQDEYLRELIEEGFKFIITSATAYGFPFELLGKIITEKDVEIIIERARKFGFNPAFEGGEAETFVVYAPLFKRELKIEGYKKKISEYEWRFIITHIH